MNLSKHKVWLAVALASVCGSSAAALNGAWRGDLNVMNSKLPLVFNFSESSDGKTSCTIDSPLQGARGIPAVVAYCDADSVAVDVNAIGAAFRGHISQAEISGTFSQRGMAFPLSLTKELSLEERRPQTPRAPFPYSTTDTTFVSADGTLLAGTITLPENPAKGCPMVVMVTGSGPQNRDEEIFEHRPFAVIADWLARQGIASLRYDDRGTAKSGGDFKQADINTFKTDAASALAFAKKLNPKGKIGVLGHSEGGTIALMLAAEGKPDFIVSLAGAMVRGKDIIMAQNLRTLGKLQLSEKQTADATSLISMVFDNIIAGKAAGEIPIDNYISEHNLDINPTVLASLKQNVAADHGDYFRQLLSLNPALFMKLAKCPVLALNGTLDTQVGSKENLDAVKANIPKAKVKEYPGLNHLFQHATTGDVSEYHNISETISPEVLADISAFILN